MNDAAVPPSRLLVGATIGNYRIVALLGQGGMGAVYLAEHPLIGKRVALKVLRDELAGDPEVVARFFGEARAVNEIGHPNIVDVLDFGQVVWGERTFVYLIMEYLDGRSLTRELAQGPLPPGRAVEIAEQIADALGASHERGIVHRDLKPDNVFLLARGGVKVLDFGIAKLTRARLESVRTRVGQVLGTPAYMSPEQCSGKGQVDARSDVYSLGCVLFEMLCGRAPFVGAGWAELITKQFTEAPPPPSSINPRVSPELDAIVLRALDKAPERRFQSMAELHEALARISGSPGLTKRESPAAISASPTGSDPAVKRPTTLTAAAGQRTSVARSGPRRGSARRRAGLAIGFLCGAAAAALAVAGLIHATRSPGRPVAPERRPVVDPPPGPIETPAHPIDVDAGSGSPPGADPSASAAANEGTVSLTVRVSPKHAEITIHGIAPREPGPVYVLPKGDRPVEVVVRADGYRPFRRTITPNRDVTIDAALKRRTLATVCPDDDPDCVLPPR